MKSSEKPVQFGVTLWKSNCLRMLMLFMLVKPFGRRVALKISLKKNWASVLVFKGHKYQGWKKVKA